MNSSTPALEIQNLHYSYKSQWTTKKFLTLQDINLSVGTGESFGFLGHNGAGKTTTIKCILGLVRPSQGLIRIFGKDSREVRARERVGYLPEQPYFYDHLSAFELVSMYAKLAGVKGNTKPAVMSALERVGILHKKNSRMRSMSKGQAQRVAMAQAIVADPKLLILDEPFSGLDPIGRKEFRDLLFEFKSEGVTIFVSSHILSDIEFLCDRVSIMSHGRIKQVLSLSELQMHSDESYELVLKDVQSIEEQFAKFCAQIEKKGELLYLRFKDKASSSEALQLALRSGADIEHFHAARGSLEELFVKLVHVEKEG